MSIYREGLKSIYAGRSIDAYNWFYLFFETQFHRHRTGADQATEQFLANTSFIGAINSVIRMENATRDLKYFSKEALSEWPQNRRKIIREIIDLRGNLRHHSLNSPKRWDPNQQEIYEAEAKFIHLIAQEVAFPKAAGQLWSTDVQEGFVQMAEQAGKVTTVIVELTVRVTEIITTKFIEMNIPQSDIDVALARVVLTQTLEQLEKIAPGAELFAIRAWQKSNKIELFRYDLGPAIAR